MGKILKKIAKTISSIIFTILLGIVILLLVYVVAIKYLEKQNRIGEVPINFYTILTQSMYPKIKAGDIIITYKNDNNKYNVGDIITFNSDGGETNGIIITHRVVEVSVDGGTYSYKTKGDNNNSADNTLVLESKVIGKVIFTIPKAGYIQQFLLTKFGWIVAIVIPCLGIIIYDVIKLVKKGVKGKKEKDLVREITPDDVAKDKLKVVLEGETPDEIVEEVEQIYDDFNIPKNKETNNDANVQPIVIPDEREIEVLETKVESEESKKEDDDIEIL